MFKPVRPPTTFEETVERLGTAIRLGLLPPGSRLPPSASWRGNSRISRSTLRQALTTLVQSGHLVSLAGPQRRHLRRRAAAAGRAGTGSPSTGAPGRCSTTGSRSRPGRSCSPPSAPTPSSSPGSRSWRSRWTTPMTSRSTAAPTSASTSASPRPPARRAWSRAMTEVQGQMSDLIALIAHPTEVLTRSNEQHRRLVEAAAQGRRGRARAGDARADRGDRAHPRRSPARLPAEFAAVAR